MHKSQQALSDIVVYNKYARYIDSENRRETWKEIIDRYIMMMVKRYGTKQDLMWYKSSIQAGEQLEYHQPSQIVKEIIENSVYLYDKKVLPSMRAAQFSGAAVEKNNSRIYNCAYLPINHYKAFGEVMFLLLGGTGVGFSVQSKDTDILPDIIKPKKERKFLISDNIEGWADSITALMKSYFGTSRSKPRFDFSDIRDKGERLITSGGKAPGPEPLKRCLFEIEQILERKEDGDKLTSLEIHDIVCHIADCVLAGGIRRAALISLFSVDDDGVKYAKFGNWWEQNGQRGRSNNSGVFLRGRVTKDYFLYYWKAIKDSGSGEPGFYFSNDPNYGSNPCCEISLRPYSYCNLTEINGGTILEDVGSDLHSGMGEFFDRARVGAFFGTLQAGFTDFHYLREIWKKNTEKDSLIGVGITGICNGDLMTIRSKYSNILKEGAGIAKKENARVAKLIGINKAARVTTVKPSGSTSAVLGVSSGIHAWHSKYYIRNMQCKVDSDLYNYFVDNHPELIKIMDYDPNSAVIGTPQKAPEGAILREDETAIQMLERVKIFNLEWVREGHRKGPNTNNVSATVSVKENEWSEVGEWMWENRNTYNGLSVLPYDGGTYKDAPFQECTKEQYEEKLKYLDDIDLTKIEELIDNTDLTGEVACAGGACEIL